MEFTAQAMAEATEEPVLHLGNLRYVGRILSAPEWFLFWDRYVTFIERYEGMKVDLSTVSQRSLLALERQGHTLRVEYLYAVFPKRRFKFWAPDPVRILARGHPRQLREAFDAFFSLQARAMGRGEPETESPSQTDGISSPSLIPVAPVSASA